MRTILERAIGIGHDIFISYSKSDGDEYARRLRDELMRGGHRRLSCFLDDRELTAGDPLTSTLRRALQRSTVLLIVGSQGAWQSNWVKREIELYLDSHKRGTRLLRIAFPNVPIPTDHPFEALLADTLAITDKPAVAGRCEPNPHVVESVMKHFDVARKSTRRMLAGGISLLLIALIPAWLFLQAPSHAWNSIGSDVVKAALVAGNRNTVLGYYWEQSYYGHSTWLDDDSHVVSLRLEELDLTGREIGRVQIEHAPEDSPRKKERGSFTEKPAVSIFVKNAMEFMDTRDKQKNEIQLNDLSSNLIPQPVLPATDYGEFELSPQEIQDLGSDLNAYGTGEREIRHVFKLDSDRAIVWLGLEVDPGQNALAVVVEKGGKKTAGNIAWFGEPVHLRKGPAGELLLVAQGNSEEGAEGTLLISEDGGLRWDTIEVRELRFSHSSLSDAVVSASDSRVMAVLFDRQMVKLSRDRGRTWSDLDVDLPETSGKLVGISDNGEVVAFFFHKGATKSPSGKIYVWRRLSIRERIDLMFTF